MAGTFELIFTQPFTASDTVVITHNMDREYLYIKLIVNGENRQDLLSRVDVDSSDPTNKLTVNLRSIQSGVIQIFSSDMVSEGDHSATGKNIKVQEDASDVVTNTKIFNFEGSVSVVDDGNDTATITVTSGPDQNLWETIAADTGSTVANTITDTLTISGGTGISTSISGDVLTIAATGLTGTEMPVAQLTKTGSVSVTSTSHTDVVFDTIDVENDDTVLDVDPDLTHIDVLEDGLYLIGYSMDVDSGANTTTLTVHLRDVGVTPIVDIPGTVRTYADAERGILAASAFVYLDAGSRLEIESKKTGAETPTIVNPTMYAMKVEGAKGDQGPPGSGSTIIVKDEGTNIANTPHDALDFVGSGVTVTDGGSGVATVTITGAADQDLFKTVVSDSGSAVADNPTDTLTLAGGTGISTSASGDTITITNTSPNVSQDVFKTIAVSGQSNVVADSSTDTLTLVAGTNMTITTNASTDTITFTASGSSTFGSQAQFASSDSTSTTTSTYSQTKTTLTTGSLPSGTYRVGYSYELGNDSNGILTTVEVKIGSTVIGQSTFESDNDLHSHAGFIHTSLSGVNSIYIKYKTDSGGTARIRNARLEIWRVS